MATAVVHFEIQASDIKRAIEFYQKVFSWKFKQWGEMEYWAIYTGRSRYPDGSPVGMDGGLLPRKGPEPVDGDAVNAFVCTMEVDSIDEVMDRIEEAGGKVVVDKDPIAGIGWQAYCKDTEGNIFGLMQNDPHAA